MLYSAPEVWRSPRCRRAWSAARTSSAAVWGPWGGPFPVGREGRGSRGAQGTHTRHRSECCTQSRKGLRARLTAATMGHAATCSCGVVGRTRAPCSAYPETSKRKLNWSTATRRGNVVCAVSSRKRCSACQTTDALAQVGPLCRDRDRGGGGGGGFVLQNARPKPLLMTRHVTIGQSNAIVRELFL